MTRNTADGKTGLFRAGATALSADKLNRVVKAVNKPLIGVSAPTQSRPFGKSGGAPVAILTLVTHADDYLECTDADANTVYVAKPAELRRTTYDGNTVGGITYTYVDETERSATDGVTTEDQFITPAYYTGCEIYGIKVSGNDTGITGGDSLPCAYVEINQGRAWAYDPAA